MRKIKLGDVLDVQRGTSLSGEYYATSGDKIRLTLGNFKYPECGFKENSTKSDIYFTGKVKDNFIMKEGDIITPLTEQVRGLLGNTATIPVSNLYIQSGDIAKIIPDEKLLNKRFSYYLISSPIVKKQLDSASQQTKIRHTSPDKIKDCIAFVPEIDTQKQIASILDLLDSKISLNNKIISELESMAKTIYDYWFLQFEFPNDEGKPYKSSGGKMVWNEELKREIPERWKVKSIFDISDVIYGVPLSVNKFSENGKFPVIRIRDILSNSISAYTDELVDEKFLTKTGDLLIGMDGNFQMNFWFRNGDCVNQRITRIREIGYPNYLIMLQIKPFIEHKVDSVARSTVGHLSDKDIKNLKILLPDESNLYKIFKVILNKQIKVLIENQELTSLRDFLLPLLMNGQVSFKKIDE